MKGKQGKGKRLRKKLRWRKKEKTKNGMQNFTGIKQEIGGAKYQM